VRAIAAVAVAVAVAALALSGCGGSGGGSSTGSPPTISGSDPGARTRTANLSPSQARLAAEIANHGVDWPFFGRVPERTHFIARAPEPPFHFIWEFFAKQLIEFPPAVEGGRIYIVNKTGEVYAVRSSDGKQIWKTKVGPDETGPAYGDGRVYIGQLNGDLSALDAAHGKRAWTFSPAGQIQSSPLVVGHTVYFGDEKGNLYAVHTTNGKLRWKVNLGSPIKASPSFHKGVVYAADYGGGVHAARASDGKAVWNVDTTDLPPGGSGGFYASPTIGFGHVYEARNDGVVYALTLKGKPSWHFVTGAPIYGSVTVGPVPQRGPTAFFGSYDHHLYAVDATTGKRFWTFDVGGPIPGTPTAVGRVVYTSSFQTQKTYGLDTETGKPAFHWGSAGYEPVVSDGTQVFLTGFETVWSFESKHPGG
jgi:outer membrane protein assembly factor BamB